MRKPWFWKARKAWYVTLPAGRIYLADTEADAYREWQQLADRANHTPSKDPTFAEIANSFLDNMEGEVARGEATVRSFTHYGWYLDRFVAIYGDILVSNLAPMHVTEWMANCPAWGVSSRRHAIGAVKRVLKWAVDEGRITRNPLSGMKRPSPRRRSQLVSTDVHATLLKAMDEAKGNKIDRQFKLALIACRQCGGRPQDVARARVEFVDKAVTTWTLPEHKTKRHTDQPRIVYLSPCLQTITKILIAGRTEGPLFRGRRGARTTKSIGSRIRSMRSLAGAPAGVVMYSYRHTYITDAMRRGVDVATVATLTGTSIEMIQRHYGHLCQRTEHLRDAAAKATRKPG